MADTRGPRADELGWAESLRAGIGFFTRLPMGGRVLERVPVAAAASAFALVGALIGLAAGTVFVIASGLGLPPLLAGVVAIAAQVLLTGALHEDGLADVADGFGGGAGRERKLAIMRDSRIGTYGVVAVALVLAARAGALADFDPWTGLAALIAAGAVSRAALAAALHLMPPARTDGLGAGAGRASADGALWSCAIAAVLAVLFLVSVHTFAWLLALVLAAVAALLVGALARRQIGGQTGDVMGAMQQACETAVLLAVAMVQ